MIEREADDSPRQGLGSPRTRGPGTEGAELNRRRDARATVRKIPERTDAMVGTRAQKNAGSVRGRRLFYVSELVEVVGVEIGYTVSEKP